MPSKLPEGACPAGSARPACPVIPSVQHHHPLRRPTSRRSLGLAWCLAALLGACGGGGNEAAPPAVTAITAASDTFSVDVGQTAQLLANDRLGSAAATAGTGGNVVFTLTSGALPAGVTVDNGTVSVAGGALPAVLNIGYRLCEAASPNNCATAAAQITIPTPPIVAAADTFSLAAGQSGDVLANDTLGGTPATAARVTTTATVALPTGVSLSAAGLVSVAAGATPGSLALGYRICQTVVPSNCATATATIVVPAAGAITGRAVDSATGLGVSGVTVAVGGLSAVTDATGAFMLSGVGAAERLTVTFTASTHAETARIASVTAATTSDVQARLVRVGTTADLPIGSGGPVTMAGSPAQVILPAAGVQRADGTVPTGTMRVRMTPIDPASDTSVMPGDFSTVVAGAAVPIESFGALNVTLADSAGTALNLRPGQSATVRIPVASRSNTVPASIPLFYFDNTSGRWVQEGMATLTGTAPNRYYQGTVTHFSTWNADQVMDTVRITGCVADATGQRVAGARVSSDGVDYSGTSTATADSAGNFTIALRRSSVATLVAQSGTRLSNTVRFSGSANDSTLSPCLTLGQAGAGLTMKLTWGARPSDLDSHLYTPSGAQVYFSSRGSLAGAPFANLDVDDTSSYGPEVVTISRLMVGTYTYFVRNYSGYSSGPIAAASARVELSIPGRAVELVTPPATGELSSTNYWVLFALDVDTQCSVTVRRLGTYNGSAPTRPVTGTPVYCQN